MKIARRLLSSANQCRRMNVATGSIAALTAPLNACLRELIPLSAPSARVPDWVCLWRRPFAVTLDFSFTLTRFAVGRSITRRRDVVYQQDSTHANAVTYQHRLRMGFSHALSAREVSKIMMKW